MTQNLIKSSSTSKFYKVRRYDVQFDRSVEAYDIDYNSFRYSFKLASINKNAEIINESE